MARSANSGAFSGSRFFGQPIIDFEPQPTTPPFYSTTLEDHRTPSSATSSLHQKLDRIIACNEEQKLAIETLKNENVALKQDLGTLSNDLRTLKESNARVNNGMKASMKLPTDVSVSTL